ncbi:EVI5-like protein isoform X2 [Quercus lobata]|uniref:EVI5-like protein isoform X2 n=1 Tax=Quercus lobata TaxID=97700 RepID=UPI001244932B|nr:EVI5-like protein isoform X2 [Quercus lobata]
MAKKRIDDYEPGPVPPPAPLDRFGFVKRELSYSHDGSMKERSAYEYEREERRVQKWRKMIGIGGSDWAYYVKRKPHVVKRRIRKGIPECLRGLIWQLISGSRDLLLMNPGVYEGMGFLAGLLLLYMSEEDAFWLLVALLKGAVHAPMEGLYLVGLPLVQQYLFQFDNLAREYLPKLGEHFTQEMVNPSMYASQWFITVFSYSFPFHLALRIWDVFLYEIYIYHIHLQGVQIVFKVGLALLKYCHDDLIKLPFEKLIYALRNFPEDAMDPDTLLPMAYSIKVSKRLEELKQDYEKKNQKPVQSKEFNEKQKQSQERFLSSKRS